MRTLFKTLDQPSANAFLQADRKWTAITSPLLDYKFCLIVTTTVYCLFCFFDFKVYLKTINLHLSSKS